MLHRQNQALPPDFYEIREVVKELFKFHSSGQFIDLAQMKCQHNLVNEINTRIIKNAHKQVYASYFSEDLDKYIQANLGADKT